MGIKAVFARSSLAKYGRSIREAPREVICNRTLLLSSALYALSGVPMSKWTPYRRVTTSLNLF